MWITHGGHHVLLQLVDLCMQLRKQRAHPRHHMLRLDLVIQGEGGVLRSAQAATGASGSELCLRCWCCGMWVLAMSSSRCA